MPLRASTSTLFAASLLVLLWTSPVLAQDTRVLPVEDPAYVLIDKLQSRGLLDQLNPTALPYSYEDVYLALDAAASSTLKSDERQWLAELDRSLDFERESRLGIDARLGGRATNHGRLDPLRFLGTDHPTVTGQPFTIDLRAFPIVASGLYATHGRFAARSGFRSDAYFDTDPDGLDTAHRWYGRSEDTYLRWQGNRAALALGRFARRWASFSGQGLLLNDYARPMDGIDLRLGNGRFVFRSLLAELDSITGDGRFTGTAGDDSVSTGSERRWLAAHRLDIRIREGLRVYLMESVLYSGLSAGPSLRYGNPLHLALAMVDERPKNEENNGLIAAGIWMQRRGLLAEAQILIDDLDVLNARESASWAADGRVRVANAVAGADLEASLTAVASRTYNTFQTEGQYLYLMKGIGTAFSDYVSLEAGPEMFVSWQGVSLFIRPYVAMLWQGERDIRDTFSQSQDTFENILTGTVSQTVRGAVGIVALRGRLLSAELDMGINRTTNDLHIQGRTRTRVTAKAGLSLWLNTSRPLE